MLTTVNPIDAVAFGRLMEFLSPDPPWNRSLWSIGLVLGMQELCEASVMLQTGTLSEASVKRICSSLQLKMGKDPALSAAEKLHLRQQIGHPPRLAALLITLSLKWLTPSTRTTFAAGRGSRVKGSTPSRCLQEAWRLTFLMQDFLLSMSASS